MMAQNYLDVKIFRAQSDSPEALLLIDELSKELAARYGDDGTGDFDPHNTEIEKSCFVIARLNEEAVGCGALRPMTENIGEVKRMFVKPEMRGKGISRKILNELEKAAKEFGYEKVWLETGVLQPEAVGLYEKDGYIRIKNYGIYENNPLSICFEKKL
jgi:N-acetylglutamate synthase-like GNAT family acetyltransferase